MEIQHTQKYIHTSPRKLRLVADMIRKMEPVRALRNLKFANKSAALPLAKAIETAIANAKQQNVAEESLSFKHLEINEGPRLPRFRAGTRGRVNPYRKKFSHIKITLTDEVKETKKQKRENKITSKKEEK